MSESSQWIAGWLASEETSQDVIAVKRIYIDINDGNLYDGLIFSQIMYWHGRNRETGKPRLTIERDGDLWLAKGYDEWFPECRIIAATARKCIDRIAERELIVKKLFKFDGAPVVHIRVNWQELESRIKSICYVVSNPNDTTGQMDTIPNIKSLTETPVETTTELKTDTRKRESVFNIAKMNDKQLQAYYDKHAALLDELLLLTGIDVQFCHWREMDLTQRRAYVRAFETFLSKGIDYHTYTAWLTKELIWRKPLRITLKDFVENIPKFRTAQHTPVKQTAQEKRAAMLEQLRRDSEGVVFELPLMRKPE